jgi:uncharacterized membrane protein
MGGFGFLITGVAILFVYVTRRRLKDLEVVVREQAEAQEDLLHRIAFLERARFQETPAAAAAPAKASVPAPPPPVATAPAPAPASVLVPAPPVAPPPPAPPVAAPVSPAVPLVVPGPPPAAAAPSTPPPPPPQRPAPAFQSVPTFATAAPRPPFDWESLVGVKLFSWIAGILFALTAITFLRYTVDHGWLTPPIRMAMGLLMGAGLLVLCEHRAARRYAITANALGAAGIVALFSTFFAAHTLWHLLGSAPTFVLMVLVTGVAVGLSIRHDALYIALLGLVGGFATPVLLSSGEDHPIGLFGYLLLLNAGLAWVALRKSWPVLSLLSLAFTTLYQWGWVFKFLTAEKMPLAMGIFLIFPLLGLLAPVLVRAMPREEEGEGPDDEGRNLFGRMALLGACLPLLFGFFLAAVPAYGTRYALLFGFLFILRAGLAAVAAARGPRILHPLAAGGSLFAFVLWFACSYEKAHAWPAILGFIALFVLFDLAAPWLAGRLRHPLGEEGRLGALAGPLLLFSFPLLVWTEPAAAAPGVPFTVLFLLLAAVAGFALLYEDGRLFSIAALFAIVAEAVWSADSLTPARLIPGVSIYAVFALFYLGVPILARRLGRRLPPAGSGAYLLLLSLGLLFFLAAGSLAQAAIWGLALLLVILNAALLLEASILRRPVFALAGTVLSWILIGVWWATVPLTATLVPALFLVAGFAVLGLAGNLWMRKKVPDGEDVEGIDGGQYLALVGHLFLFVVATQPRLSIPPWPFLGVLLVLDLAVGAAALWLRRAALWIAALVASDLILLFWGATADKAPWPPVALASALAVSALGLVWISLARRLGRRARLADGMPLAVRRGAVASLFLGEVVAIMASMSPGAPPLAFTIGAHVAFLVALLWLSVADLPWVAPASIVLTTAAVSGWRNVHLAGPPSPWWFELAFAGALYLSYLVFPLVLGERARRLRQPFLAAVLASLSFFLLARHALLAGGYGGVIGALPVAQAIALSVLLARLIRMERRDSQGIEGEAVDRAGRDPGRLALMAGAVLACVTAAIPLQLDREWITIGWALLAAGLAALYLRIPHRGLLWWCAGLLGAVFVRLTLNRAVLAYHPMDYIPLFNWYLYTYLVPALAFFLAAWLLSRGDDTLGPPLPRLSRLAAGGGVVLLFLLVNIEIADFFSTGSSLTFGFLTGDASLAEDLAYTLGWALFAIALFGFGITRRQQVARIAAIVLLLVAVLKGFVHDMAQLGGLYRIGSFAGLGLCLALVAVMIQKYVLPRREAK